MKTFLMLCGIVLGSVMFLGCNDRLSTQRVPSITDISKQGLPLLMEISNRTIVRFPSNKKIVSVTLGHNVGWVVTFADANKDGVYTTVVLYGLNLGQLVSWQSTPEDELIRMIDDARQKASP